MDTVDLNHRIITWATGQPEINALYLFGSQVKGRANALSDIDVAILVQSDLKDHQVWALEDKWAAEWGETIDLRILNLAPVEFQFEVITTGDKLWVRDANQIADFESLVRRKFWDLKPLIDQNWASLKTTIAENRSELERIEYQATLEQIRAVHRRVREASKSLTNTTAG